MSRSLTLIVGANTFPVNLNEGMTIGDVREEYGTLFSIPANSTATVNGAVRNDDWTLCNEDTVVFTKLTGTKG